MTSLLLGNGLPDAISAPVQLDPNNPKNAYAQEQYNMAAIQVLLSSACLRLATGQHMLE